MVYLNICVMIRLIMGIVYLYLVEVVMIDNIKPNVEKISFKEKLSAINPFTNPKRCNAEALEDYFQDKTEVLVDRVVKGKHKELGGRLLCAVPLALGKSIGEVVDKAVERVEDVRKTKKSTTDKIEKTKAFNSGNVMKNALTLAAAGIAGGTGLTVAIVKVGIDTFTAIQQSVKQLLYHSIDGMEGTELRKLSDEKSIVKITDKKLKAKAKELQKEHKILGAVTGALGGIALNLFAKPVLNLADTGLLIHERMDKRALKKGVNYAKQKESAHKLYESTDKGFDDKLKLAGKRIGHNIKKVTDLRAGDVARLAFSAFGVVACVTNIFNIFSVVGKAGDVISAIKNNEDVVAAFNKKD